MRQIIGALPVPKDERVLIGFGNAEDAAVYQLDAERALIFTTDVITPLVDTPHLFGAIAATNALSDVYAMGGEAIMALSIFGVPDDLPTVLAAEIAKGGAEKALAEGAPVVGGHTLSSRDLIYGLAVVGTAHPDRLFRNDRLAVGDQLVLSKPLGTGTLTTAIKNAVLREDDIAEAITGMTQSNRAAVAPLHRAGVVAATDITGFGLLGHGAELAKASGVELVLELAAVPRYAGAEDMLARKLLNRGHRNNFAYAQALGPCSGEVALILRDPQTSGGLLAAVKPERLDTLLADLKAAGYPRAVRVGEVRSGAGVRIV